MLDGFQNQFLVFYGLVVTCVVLSLLFLRRKPDQPFRLKLRSDKKPSSSAQRRPLQSSPLNQAQGGAEVFEEDYEPSVKQLGVMFNYNGHSWEAFESLGLPAGSSVEEVQRVYERLRRGCEDPYEENFFKAAYQAIMQSR